MCYDFEQDKKLYNRQKTEYVLYERDKNQPILVLESLKDAKQYALKFRMSGKDILIVSRTIIEELKKS